MDRGLLTAALVGFLGAVTLLSPFNSAKAGFLDWLFGTRRPAVAVQGHPDVTIRKPRATRSAKARAPVAPALTPKEQLARTIDPNVRPDWHLIDPTLKKGDVLFLRNRVLVFKGPTVGKLSNYVPVRGTRLLSAKERRLIEAMSPRPGDAPAVAVRKPSGKSVASVGAAPSFDLRIRAN